MVGMSENTDPPQIVCTGEEGSDEWNCAFGTWAADDFGIDSDEPIGEGERLYVRRDLYDQAVRNARRITPSIIGYRGPNAVAVTLMMSDGSELVFDPDQFNNAGV